MDRMEEDLDERGLNDQTEDLEEYDEDEDDPIVKRMGLFFNSSPDFSLPSFVHFQPILEEDEKAKEADNPNGAAQEKKGIKTLSLLQYPFKSHNPKTSHGLLPPSLRPDSVNSEQQQVPKINVRYKPGVRYLKLEIPLEIKNGIREDRFSEDRAREYGKASASHINQQNNPKNVYRNPLDDDAEPIDRINLTSNLIPEQTNYLIGMIKKNQFDLTEELHLVSLDQTLQLRPNLDYLDKLDQLNLQQEKNRKRENGNESDSDDENNNNSDIEESEELIKKKTLAKKKLEAMGAQAIQVSVVGQNNDNNDKFGLGRTNVGMFAPLRAAEAESAINLTYYHSETKESDAIRQKMFSTNHNTLTPVSAWNELLKV